jgi:hypothetical protein
MIRAARSEHFPPGTAYTDDRMLNGDAWCPDVLLHMAASIKGPRRCLRCAVAGTDCSVKRSINRLSGRQICIQIPPHLVHGHDRNAHSADQYMQGVHAVLCRGTPPVYKACVTPALSMVTQPLQQPDVSAPLGVGERAVGICVQCTKSSLIACPQTIPQSQFGLSFTCW